MFYRRLLAVGLGLLIGASVLAQPPERVTLSLDNADIRDLINWAADFTGKNIVVHPNVKGKVTVVAGDPMTHEEAFNVFMSVLQVNGFSLVEQGNAWKVVPDALAKQQAIPVVDLDSKGPMPAESLVVRTVRVENISAAQLIAMLRPLIPQTGHLAAYADTNTLIIADRAANIDQIVRLVHQLDRAGAIDIEMVPLQFASAKDIKQVLSELLQSGGKQGNDVQPLRIAVDERSNSVLLTGDPVTRQQLKDVIRRLDQPLDGDGNTAVIYVQYANAADLKPILEGMSGSIQKTEKDQQAADVEVSIQVNESLNSLVLTAPPALLETMKGVIAKLDVRRAQVLIEALIVEVTEGDKSDLGIRWIAGADDDVVAGFNNNVAEGEITDDEGNVISDVNPFSLDPSNLMGTGLNLGYLSGTDLRVAIKALATESNSNILSTPQVIALDNEEAEILVGQNVPFVTGEQLLSGSNNDPFTTIQREDVGTTLTVKPRVNNNNSVTLEIEQKVENVLPSSAETSEAADLITSKREIRTKVLIDDGAILVLGGLIEDKVTETKSKVPLLGDIPGIGRLFRSSSKDVTKTNLMVFLRPKILNTQIAGYEETRKRYLDMQEKQIRLRGDTSVIWDWHRGDVLPDLTPPTGSYDDSAEPQDDGAPMKVLDAEVIEAEK